jgi:hypothetical protein
MRQQDKDEVWASGGFTPLEALAFSVEVTNEDMRWTALADGVPFCMWGASEHIQDPTLGVVWLLGSDHIYQIKRRFILESRKYVSMMHDRFDTLANYVDARNTVSMRWLETLGFHAVRTVQHHGHERRPFILYASYGRTT